ncbi:hypothetical protein LPJ54_006991, partial [Coemansia sp. RSA 1824]
VKRSPNNGEPGPKARSMQVSANRAASASRNDMLRHQAINHRLLQRQDELMRMLQESGL